MPVGTLEALVALDVDKERAVALLLKSDVLDVAKLDSFVVSEEVILETIDETTEFFVLVTISEALAMVELLSDGALELARLEEIDEASEEVISDQTDGSGDAVKLIDADGEVVTVELLPNITLDLLKLEEVDEVLEVAILELLDETLDSSELDAADVVVETVEL